MKDHIVLTPYQQIIRDLSERLVKAQQPIRLLDAIKWDSATQEYFFKHKFKKLPPIDQAYYQQNPLSYDITKKNEEFYDIERDIRHHLGQFSPVGNMMQRMCREYREVVRMIAARGKPEFSKISQELFGSSEDAFFIGNPSLKDLAEMISAALVNLKDHTLTENDKKIYTSEQAVVNLQARMAKYFHTATRNVKVKISDGIIADAAAGADSIKIRSGMMFSERDLRVLEVHEGWVHMGTTLNGMAQPICTFLSKGTPSASITQEGLAIITEIFTFASYPGRLRRLTNRITAIHMAEKGASFIDVFKFFLEQGMNEEVAYNNTTRVYRGSTPDGSPFTKDLCYSKGFVLIYNYIRLAVQRGVPSRIPLLFTGKTTLEDLRTISDLVEEGIIVPPKFLPPQFRDLAALTAWMCYSLFLNRLNLEKIAVDYKDVL